MRVLNNLPQADPRDATGSGEVATARAFQLIRGRLAFCGLTPEYWRVLDLHGLGALGRELNAMSKPDEWTDMAACVSDDAVRRFAAIGTHKESRSALAARAML